MAIFQPFRPAYLADPYPYLHRLRAEDPVHRAADLNAWVLTRHADVLRVLTDDGAFSSDPVTSASGIGDAVRRSRAESPMGDAPILGNTDPPDHTRLRAIVNRAFTPRNVAAFEPQATELVEALIGRIGPGEPFDLMRTVAEPLAVLSILAFVGVPAQDAERVRAWGLALMAARSAERSDPAAFRAAVQAHAHFSAYLTGAPRRGVMGELLAAAAEGERISLDEMMMLLIHISTAGNGPAAFGLANLLNALAAHPGQYALLREDPTRAAAAIDELLRYDSPVHVVHRFAREPVEIGGKTIRAGDTVMLCIAAANRDPAAFPDPDRLDILREPGRILSFGHGIHFCLGAPLARLELTIALRTFAARFATIEVLPPGPERAPDLLLRGPRRLAMRGT